VPATPTKPDDRAAGARELLLTLELQANSPTALPRAIAVLHRRCCRITQADYQSGIGDHDQLALRVQAPRAHAHCVTSWLSALVEVQHITSADPSITTFPTDGSTLPAAST
jgi:hypothetical protein